MGTAPRADRSPPAIRLTRPEQDRVAEALFGRTRRQLLALFFGRPGRAFYVREIGRYVSGGVGAVQRELKRLHSAGLISRMESGSQVYYQANRHSPVFSELRSLLAKTAGIADVIRVALRRSPGRPFMKAAFIYGSVAAGRHSPDSDIDLIIIGDTALPEVIPFLERSQRRLGREINTTIYGADEFRKNAHARGHFVSRLLAKPRIMLIGTDDDLEKLAGKPLHPTS